MEYCQSQAPPCLHALFPPVWPVVFIKKYAVELSVCRQSAVLTKGIEKAPGVRFISPERTHFRGWPGDDIFPEAVGLHFSFYRAALLVCTLS